MAIAPVSDFVAKPSMVALLQSLTGILGSKSAPRRGYSLCSSDEALMLAFILTLSNHGDLESHIEAKVSRVRRA